MSKKIHWLFLAITIGLAGCSSSPFEKLDSLSDRLVKAVSFGTGDETATKPVSEKPVAEKSVEDKPVAAKAEADKSVTDKPSAQKAAMEKSMVCEAKGKGTGFIRVDYLQGDVKSVVIEGLSKPYALGLGQYVSEKVPLGEYHIKGSGLLTGTQDVPVCVDRPNEIRVVSFVSTTSGQGQLVTANSTANLATAYGVLKVVTTVPNASFDIISAQTTDFRICLSGQLSSCNVPGGALSPSNLPAPSEFKLPVGQYSVVRNKVTVKVTIAADKTSVVELTE